MRNNLPTNWGQLFNLATKMYTALLALAAGIPVTMVTAAQMLTSKTAFKNAGTAFNVSRSNLRNAYQVSNPAQEALYQWLLKARAILALQLGERWSAAWAAAGFTAPSTQVPRSREARIALGTALVTYFTDNPTRERPDDEVTAAKATELTDAAISGQAAVTTAEQAHETAKETRVVAKTDLTGLMVSVITNLKRKLAKDDPRWLAFGLEMPSTQTTPAAPTGLRATVMGSQVLLECDVTPLATRYRFRTRIVGLDAKYKLAASSLTPMAMLEGVAAGITLEIIAQAVNGSSQSVASEPITVTMPPAEAPAAISPEELAPLTAITPNGNGNGNGSTALSRLS